MVRGCAGKLAAVNSADVMWRVSAFRGDGGKHSLPGCDVLIGFRDFGERRGTGKPDWEMLSGLIDFS